MPDGYGLTLEVGVGNSGLASPGSSSGRVLTVSGRDVAPWASGICALIGGEAQDSAEAYEAIGVAFRRETAVATLHPGAEERYIEGVLSPYAGGRVGIALVLWIGETAYLSWVGGYGTHILQGMLLRDARDLIPAGPTDHVVPVLRVPLNSHDQLVLADERVMRNVQRNEIRETLLRPTQSLSLQGEAAWLSALAEGRSGEASNAVVLRFSSSAIPRVASARRSHARPRRMVLSFFAGVVAVVAVVSALLFRPHGSAVPRLVSAMEMPQGLTVVRASTSDVVVEWQPVVGATGYRVRVAGREYRSALTHLELHRILRAGKRYQWRVRAEFRDHMGRATAPQVFNVPTLPSFPAPVSISPSGTSRIRSDGGVQFCWHSRIQARRFDLYIKGTGVDVHQVPIPAIHDPQCARNALHAPGTYRWEVGAVAPGYLETYTPWQQVRVLSRASARHRRGVHAVRGHVTPKAKAQGHVVYRPPKQILPTPTPLPIPVLAQPQPAVQPVVPLTVRSVPAPAVQRQSAARPTVQAPVQRPAPHTVPPQPTARPVVQQPAPRPVPPVPAAPQPTTAPPQPVVTPPVVSCPSPPNCS